MGRTGWVEVTACGRKRRFAQTCLMDMQSVLTFGEALDLDDHGGHEPALARLERGVWPARAGT